MYKSKYQKYKKKYLDLKNKNEKKNLKKKISRIEKVLGIKNYKTNIQNVNFDQLSRNEFTSNVYYPNTSKILYINTMDDFDKFINRYGLLDNNNNFYIRWNDVATEFKGFYLNPNLYNQLNLSRYPESILNNQDFDIWRNKDYNQDVVIFI